MQSKLDEILREIKELKESVKAKKPKLNDVAVISQYNIINNFLRAKLLSKRMSRKIIRVVTRNLQTPNQLGRYNNMKDLANLIDREEYKEKRKKIQFSFPKGSVL